MFWYYRLLLSRASRTGLHGDDERPPARHHLLSASLFIVWTFSVNRTWFKDTSDTFGGVRPFIGLGSQSVSQCESVDTCLGDAQPVKSDPPRLGLYCQVSLDSFSWIQLEIHFIYSRYSHSKKTHVYIRLSFILIVLPRLRLNLFPLRAQQAELKTRHESTCILFLFHV